MTETTEKAILGGGLLLANPRRQRKRPGVISTRVGYTGGDVPNASYRHHARTPRRSRSSSTPQQISYGRVPVTALALSQLAESAPAPRRQALGD